MKLEPSRLAEAGAEAALILALVVLPAGVRTLDTRLTVVLTAMLLMLTVATYALHAVTFDYLRITAGRAVERTDP